MKTNLRKFIVCLAALLFLTGSTSVLADKFLKATIVYIDGKEMDGYVHSGINNFGKLMNYTGDVLKFKPEEKSKPSKLSAEDIDRITFYTDSESITLKYVNVKTATLKGKYKSAKNKLWLYVVESCDDMEVYETFGGFDVSRTKVYLNFVDPDLNRIYIKRNDEVETKMVATALSSYYPARKSPFTVKKFNKKTLYEYFKDNQEALKILDSETASIKLILKVFDSICQSNN